MTRKNNGQRGEKDEEADTNRGLFAGIVEGVVTFAICCFLIELGVNCILAVRIPLLIMSAIIVIIFIIYRIWRWKGRHDDY